MRPRGGCSTSAPPLQHAHTHTHARTGHKLAEAIVRDASLFDRNQPPVCIALPRGGLPVAEQIVSRGGRGRGQLLAKNEVHTHTQARTHTRAHTRTHTHTHANTRAHTHAYTHTHMDTHTHTHTYTHIRNLTQARELDAPLDVLIVRKLGAPHHPEYGVGALAEGGVCIVNEQVCCTGRGSGWGEWVPTPTGGMCGGGAAGTAGRSSQTSGQGGCSQA